ncbi:MAG: trypsin-like serine protease, partial [Elusimicrobiaceae bacterium]|nr:trypsin-like serine protease [Elusimicrobiaceae bacterium]
MRKYIFLVGILLVLSVALTAGVDFIRITDEDQYKSVKDFTNTYEINFNRHHTKDLLKCQAVRLSKNWFITAAHCVSDVCINHDCSFQARLLVGPNYEADFTTTHGKSFGKKIYTFSKTKLGKKEILYDVALIYFDPRDTKLVWKDPRYNSPLTESMFLRRIPSRADYVKAVNGTNLPMIL